MDIEMTLEDLFAGLGPGELTARSPTGRPRDEYEAVVVRNLLEEDLELPPHESQSQAPPLQNIRTNHHKLAQAIALGDRTYNEISVDLGYSTSRINTLLGDPAFIEIVEAYKKEMVELFVDVQTRLRDLSIDSLDILKSRLDEESESFSINQLLEVTKVAADRSGNGPASTTKHDHTVSFATPDRIAQIKNKVNERHNGEIKQINQTKAIEAPNELDELSEISGIEECEVIEISTANVCEETKAEREPSEGNDLRAGGGSKAETKDCSRGIRH